MSKKHIKRKYKDTIFRMIFKERKELLSLYNAINGTNYTNLEELQITTLENAIYLSMKNDVSCCIDMNLQLYEQQSTVNPNMAIRFYQYYSKLLEKFLVGKKLYSRKRIMLPTPQFYVLYNGEEVQPERKLIKLSDSFVHKTEPFSVDLFATQLNINPGYNETLKEKCPMLMQYVEYVSRVRNYSHRMPLKEAVSKAIDECIKENILKDFLLKNKAQVVEMCIFEFDEEEYKKTIYEEAYEDGEAAGEAAGKRTIARNMKVKGMDNGFISEMTGLSVEEIQGIVP